MNKKRRSDGGGAPEKRVCIREIAETVKPPPPKKQRTECLSDQVPKKTCCVEFHQAQKMFRDLKTDHNMFLFRMGFV